MIPDGAAQRVRERSTLRRALLPVAGGLAFFVLLAVLLWLAAAFIANNPDDVEERLATTTFEVGSVETLSSIIADDGPLIFPDLVRSGGNRTVVLDHTGADVRRGWSVYFAHPADRGLGCKVEQVRGTRDFVDCDGRTVAVEQLAPAVGVTPVISDVVVIDLREATSGTEPSPSTS
jgi:hypothetical protein